MSICFSDNIYAATILQQVQGNIVALSAAQKKVENVTQELKTTHQSIQTKVINKIAGVQSRSIAPYNKEVKDVIKKIKDVPSIAMKSLCLGPLSSTLKDIRDLLSTIGSMLSGIVTSFSSANKLLDPKKDPDKIYYHLQVADDKFDAAIKKLQQLEKALKNV